MIKILIDLLTSMISHKGSKDSTGLKLEMPTSNKEFKAEIPKTCRDVMRDLAEGLKDKV